MSDDHELHDRELDPPELSPRQELHGVARALRGYVEWHDDCGSSGFPRAERPWTARAVAPEGDAAPEPTEPEDRDEPAAHTPRHEPARPTARDRAEALEDDDAVVRALRELAPSRAPTADAESPRAAARAAPTATLCAHCVRVAAPEATELTAPSGTVPLVWIGEWPGGPDAEPNAAWHGELGALLKAMRAAMQQKATAPFALALVAPSCGEPAGSDAARSHLAEQLRALQPRAAVAFGRAALAALLDPAAARASAAGQWKLHRGRVPVMPTYALREMLPDARQPSQAKRASWLHLQEVLLELQKAH